MFFVYLPCASSFASSSYPRDVSLFLHKEGRCRGLTAHTKHDAIRNRSEIQVERSLTPTPSAPTPRRIFMTSMKAVPTAVDNAVGLFHSIVCHLIV